MSLLLFSFVLLSNLNISAKEELPQRNLVPVQGFSISKRLKNVVAVDGDLIMLGTEKALRQIPGKGNLGSSYIQWSSNESVVTVLTNDQQKLFSLDVRTSQYVMGSRLSKSRLSNMWLLGDVREHGKDQKSVELTHQSDFGAVSMKHFGTKAGINQSLEWISKKSVASKFSGYIPDEELHSLFIRIISSNLALIGRNAFTDGTMWDLYIADFGRKKIEPLTSYLARQNLAITETDRIYGQCVSEVNGLTIIKGTSYKSLESAGTPITFTLDPSRNIVQVQNGKGASDIWCQTSKRNLTVLRRGNKIVTKWTEIPKARTRDKAEM